MTSQGNPGRSLGLRDRTSNIQDFVPGLVALDGWAQYRDGKLWHAYRIASQAVRTSPENGRCWELLGLIFRDLAKPRSAVNALETASISIPLYPLSQICLAESYAANGKTQLAKELYLSRVKLDVGSAELLLLIASGLEGVDAPNEALEVCRIAGALRPESGQVAYDMSFYASRCGMQLALVETLAWRAVELEPNNVHFRIGLCSLLIRLEEFDKAFWVVRQLTEDQIQLVTCQCCLSRIAGLYELYDDCRMAMCCRIRVAALESKSSGVSDGLESSNESNLSAPKQEKGNDDDR